MAYVLKIADCDSFVESFAVSSHHDDQYVHVSYTDNPKNALTYDDMEDVATHYWFIVNNMSILDLGTNPLCIAEAQTYYKEL